jgi:putative ABC transport system permease protein
MASAIFTATAVEGRRAARGLVKSPGFSVGVVLVLGIAIAGMVTVATAAYELFLKPLPFPRSEQLVHVTTYSESMGFEIGFVPPMLVEIRQEPMVTELAAYHEQSTWQSEEGEGWRGAAVTHNLTGTLGVRPLLGRAFVPADAEPGAPRVALISETVWRNRFGADEKVIGRELSLQERRVRIVGVMPASFGVPASETELWQPLQYTPEELTPSDSLSFQGGHMVARLAPGYTPQQLQEALRARQAAKRPRRVEQLMRLEYNVSDLRNAWTADQRQPLTIIGLASLLVFAAALFNVAGLWLTRLLARTHEHAIQAALGAGGLRRLARTGFEFLIIGVAGSAVALALTVPALGWLEHVGVLDPNQPLGIRTGPATVVSALLLLLAGSLPVLASAAWQQRRERRELLTALAGGSRSGGSGARARRVLIVAQVALAMSILCALGLLLRSWQALLTEDLGFEPRNLLVARILQNGAEDSRTRDPVVAAALDAARGIPGVREVTYTNVAPFAGSESVSTIQEPGRAEGQETTVRSREVGERYFEAVGIPILHGRSFGPGDAGVIIDQYFADRYFPDGAVGEYLRLAAGPEGLRDAQILGVAGTAKYRTPDEQPNQGTLYELEPGPRAAVSAVVSTALPPAGLADDLQAVLEEVLGSARVGDIVTMENLVRRTVQDREPQLMLLAIFAAEALALAGIGLFSLLTYSVRARTAEFGVRQTVGASPANIRHHVLGDAVRLLVPGLLAGIVGGWMAGKLVSSRLYEVSPIDPVTWAATGIVLAVVVLTAGLWPAARAARIQPTEALRHE